MTSPTPPTEIPPQYDAASTEAELSARWQAAGIFTADADRSSRLGGAREPFTIVIPPPNVTAVLHMGHGLDNVAQDLLVRWRRMAGDEALWVPGTDHAGIATQNVVERLIAKCGLTRFDVGREAFVRRTEEFVRDTGGKILDQLRAIGASCDWTRTAYTLSPELSRAVREAFVRLYDDGLVYRGHRVIHWCPRCLTSLSDEEAEFEPSAGKLYHISYPLADGDGAVTVATTRPETMLGDVAVCVHPDDERYRALVGRAVRLPVAGVEIPVIADAYVDPAFGTGVVKITPAHDANDFDVGVRHALAMPVVISPEGAMGEVSDADGRVPEGLRGLDRFQARERIVALLREAGQLEKVEPHEHAVRHCYRCATVVEPRLSDQWFVRMKPLAEPALAARRDGTIRIVPERWEAVYDRWLENIRDWNISRQLWWGHRIPVWYCDACGSEPIVRRDDVTACPSCGGPVRQDEDVLDTWFSSWLWPISTLGWPTPDTKDFRAFYPTDVLVSGPDILFFWIARMIMSGLYFVGRAPYHTVYLHGIVRDPQHRKMSKSLGNGIDPLDVVGLYGADALRYTVIAGMGLGVDIVLDPDNLEKSFAPGRNFATKLWNIGRFLLSRVGTEGVRRLDEIDDDALTAYDRFILARLDGAIRACDASLGPARPTDGRWTDAERTTGLRLNEYIEGARRFVWNEMADWYVEACKARLATDGEDREVARAVLVHVFDSALRLLHPAVPFITEALWQRLPGRRDGEYLAVAPWPTPAGHRTEWEGWFDHEQENVAAVRAIRNDFGVSPSAVTAVYVELLPSVSAEEAAALRGAAAASGSLCRSEIRYAPAPAGTPLVHAVTATANIAVAFGADFDVGKQCAKLRGELAGLEKQLAALEARLANEGFVARAPAQVVDGERQKAREWTVKRDQLRARVGALCGG